MNQIEYKPGTVLELSTELVRLVERKETYPTSGQWAKVRWEVEVLDKQHKPLPNGPFYRHITEIGTANSHSPEKIPGLDWKPPVEETEEVTEVAESEDGETKPVVRYVPKEKRGRGRPEGPMTDIKARNILRLLKKGEMHPKLEEAKDFLIKQGDEKFVDKYVGKYNPQT